MTRNRRRIGSISFVTFLAWLASTIVGFPVRAESPAPGASRSAIEQTSNDDRPAVPPRAKSGDAAVKHDPADHPSEAERIAGLKRTIETEQARLRELDAELNDPQSEYNVAEGEFQALDRQLDQKRDALQKLKEHGQTATATRVENEIKTLEKEWSLAKDRFDLAIEERKTLRDEIATFTKKIQKDREALDHLTGVGDEMDAERRRDDAANATKGNAAKKELHIAPGDSTGLAPQDAANDGAKTKSEDADTSGDSDVAMDAELIAAETEAKAKEEEAEEAQEEVQSIAARIADLQRLIAQEQKSLGLARRKADLAVATERGLEQELARRTADGVATQELDELRARIRDVGNRQTQAKADVAESIERLNESQSELASLQSQQIIALQQAEAARLQAEAAKEKVADLRNPFAPRNLLQWSLDHGPRLAMILAGMFAMLQFGRLFSHRTIKLVARGTGRGSSEERENRAKTLVGVFQNAVSVAIVIGGFLMMLDEVGVKVTVLLGGMAVCGLAVAFGAQSLIKDYFYGFVMLLENQYMINDVVKIGEFTGQVERITLRMTVLRDSNGVVHFIPNGSINAVSNETHGWSRAVLEVGVAYKEDIARVIGVLTDLTREFRQDPTFGPHTIDDATTPAVDSLGDSAVVLKFSIKTRPAQQVAIRRELLRRIKHRFDSLGIEIPFPQRTVYHRYEDGVAVPHVEMKRAA